MKCHKCKSEIVASYSDIKNGEKPVCYKCFWGKEIGENTNEKEKNKMP